jgi:hypothetical protein
MLLPTCKLTVIQPLAARHEVANRLSKSRDAIMAVEFRQAWSSMQAVFSQLLMSNYVRFKLPYHDHCHVLTNELADFHAMPQIASFKMDALAIRIARQTVPRVSSPKVRVRVISSHSGPC